jgi:hypothetical protein
MILGIVFDHCPLNPPALDSLFISQLFIVQLLRYRSMICLLCFGLRRFQHIKLGLCRNTLRVLLTC